ncbi:MAG: hypothetical protein WBP55_05930 [Solirubrobacterales bacterium]
MKQTNVNRNRNMIEPIRIDLSEAEIMADLQYPVATPQPPVSRPASRRKHSN